MKKDTEKRLLSKKLNKKELFLHNQFTIQQNFLERF